MKTNLGSRSSLFRKIADQTPFDTCNSKVSNKMIDIFVEEDIDHLFYRVQEAIRARDLDSLPWLHLELQARSTMMLRKIEQDLCDIRKELSR
jgi:hypothetical protein